MLCNVCQQCNTGLIYWSENTGIGVMGLRTTQLTGQSIQCQQMGKDLGNVKMETLVSAWQASGYLYEAQGDESTFTVR